MQSKEAKRQESSLLSTPRLPHLELIAILWTKESSFNKLENLFHFQLSFQDHNLVLNFLENY